MATQKPIENGGDGEASACMHLLCSDCLGKRDEIAGRLVRVVEEYLYWWDEYGSQATEPRTKAEFDEWRERAHELYLHDPTFNNRVSLLVQHTLAQL